MAIERTTNCDESCSSQFGISGRNENDEGYQRLALSNHIRQLEFLQSIVIAALESGRPFLSAVIKALNYLWPAWTRFLVNIGHALFLLANTPRQNITE